MKQLTLIRHAKSSWDNPNHSDFERPLNKRGRTNAAMMSQFMKENLTTPDKILCSDSARTRETAEHIIEALHPTEITIDYHNSLYLAPSARLLDMIQKEDDALSHLGILAHNPGITDFCNLLAESKIDNVPTFGVITFTLDIKHWNEAAIGCGTQTGFFYPKMAALFD